MKQRVIISTNWKPWHAEGIYHCWQHLEYIALRRCSGSETTHLSSVTPLKNSIRNVRSFWIPVGFNTSNTLWSYKTLLYNHHLKEEKIKFQTLESFFFSHFCCSVCNHLLKLSMIMEWKEFQGFCFSENKFHLLLISIFFGEQDTESAKQSWIQLNWSLCLLFHWILVI